MASLFDYDDNRYGQPIEDVIVYHDIIDGRKLRSVMNSGESAMFNPQTSKIIHLHNKKQQSESNLMDWIYQNYDVRKGADKRLLKALFLYLYRGTDPSFFPPEDEVDAAMEGLVQMVDDSPYAEPYRKMCRLNRWHTDVIGRLIFDEIMAEAKGMMDALSEAMGGGSPDGQPRPSGEGDGQGSEGDGSSEGSGQSSGSGKDDSSQGDSSGSPQQSDGDESGSQDQGSGQQQGSDAGDGGGNHQTPDATKTGDGKPGDGKAAVSTNQARRDAQSLVNRAMERVRQFTKETDVDPGTSIDKMMEAAKKMGDGEKNPFTDHGLIQIDMSSIADKMGRMRSIFDAEQATRIEFAPGAVVSLCYGNDIRNVVPQELALMADPDTSVLFDMKYLQRRLLTRKTEGVTRGGKGPIIMCIDVSGSMDAKLLSWAMSLAGAIGYTAASQGRDVAFVYYSDTVPDIIALDYEAQVTLEDLERAIQTVIYNKRIGSGEPHEHSMIPRMQAAGLSRRCEANGGGTFYGSAFQAVRDLFSVMPQWERGDLLFLTDGGDAYGDGSRELCEELQALGVRVFGIGLIDADHGNPKHMEGVMERNLGYFDAYSTVKFGIGYSTDDVIKQVAESL